MFQRPTATAAMAYKKWIIPGCNERGQSLSIEKASHADPYVVTLWEQGLPVARKPIPAEKALKAIAGLSAIVLP